MRDSALPLCGSACLPLREFSALSLQRFTPNSNCAGQVDYFCEEKTKPEAGSLEPTSVSAATMRKFGRQI